MKEKDISTHPILYQANSLIREFWLFCWTIFWRLNFEFRWKPIIIKLKISIIIGYVCEVIFQFEDKLHRTHFSWINIKVNITDVIGRATKVVPATFTYYLISQSWVWLKKAEKSVHDPVIWKLYRTGICRSVVNPWLKSERHCNSLV